MKLREIVDAKITHVSFVKKGANGKDFLIMKSDDQEPTLEKETPILKVQDDKKLVTGIVYEPDTVDSQNEFMKADAIEKAAHKFMEDYRNIDKNHTFNNENVSVVESFVTKGDTKIGDTSIKKGTWVMTTKVNDDKLWEDVKKGNIKGYSMGGVGKKIEHNQEPAKVKKSNEENPESEEMKGFFNVLKSFFAGDSIQKENKTTVSFADRMAVNDVTEGMWRVNDTLRSTMRDILNSQDIKEKQPALNKAIDEFGIYMKNKIKNVGTQITKADEDFFGEPVEKAGKKISASRMTSIKNAITSLQNLVQEVEENEDTENSEEEDEVKKEDIASIIKEAMTPINERLDKIEKGESSTSQQVDGVENDKITKEDLTEVIKEAMVSIESRLEKVEKTRGISKQIDEVDTVQKSNSVFSGIQI
ncbi:XkdF-like putative serine protease domain-containing protein [Anaerophilus nitritogenes]|uniref:XkdF-like putative serine protease domain-containing protein n=1 Tax=Anaerophilus nitritogenes TaxID=2498136 RepID=UPI00101D3F79|nr:XkdF-like putative serine protease domain-containing protein [Anaerophilus nitritogenes]